MKTLATTANTTTTKTVVPNKTIAPKKPLVSIPSIRGWKLKKDGRPADLAVQIMSYRREYGSKGVATFAEEWLEPKIKAITDSLRQRGYVVAARVCGTEGSVTFGYKNYCYDISKKGEDVGDTLFVAHYDTVDNDVITPRKVWDSTLKRMVDQPAMANTAEAIYKKVSVEDGVAFLDMFDKANHNVGCLGADDGAGLAVMLYLMNEGVAGGYCFTTGEECGGLGARAVLSELKPFLKQYQRSIEIDRRGFSDVIYEQGVGECASVEFAQFVCSAISDTHLPSNGGSYTDVATFAEVIPENVNIAAGYINAHQTTEKVLLPYLDIVADKLKAVDWTKAPSVRLAGDFGLPAYNYGYGYGSYNRYGSFTKTATYDEVDELTAEDYDHIKKIIVLDPEFLQLIMEYKVESLVDLDALCLEVYGVIWQDILVDISLVL